MSNGYFKKPLEIFFVTVLLVISFGSTMLYFKQGDHFRNKIQFLEKDNDILRDNYNTVKTQLALSNKEKKDLEVWYQQSKKRFCF